MKNTRSAQITEVKVNDPYLAPRIRRCLETTIPKSVQHCRTDGRIDAFKLQWKEGMPNKPHIFWDSDVAKVLEGMAYAFQLTRNPELEKELEELAGLIVSAQREDGYLNTHFTVVEPEKRWKCLQGAHELYCAGHLIEAAVAHFRATGKRNFLDCMCRYADYIATVFGRGKGQRRGYPGHEEIELALCKLAEATGKKKYLDLAKYFVDERGQSPNYFLKENPQCTSRQLENHQALKPVREERNAVGHAVRAVYLYSGMADVAQAAGDKELLRACEAVFDSISEKRMFLTGGIGSDRSGESFENDYNLPDHNAYAESCASIGLVFFASRMFNITGDGKYMDVLERALYNGIPSGISLDGYHYFYKNLLRVDRNTHWLFQKTRLEWYDCSCCPTNFCRFLPQIGTFLWSANDEEVKLNIPAASVYEAAGRKITVRGSYPYGTNIEVEFGTDAEFTFSVRIPLNGGAAFRLNGTNLSLSPRKGYVSLRRKWKKGDRLDFTLDMPVIVLRAHSSVTFNAGQLALMRGPLVYALENLENIRNLSQLLIPAEQSFKLAEAKELPPGTLAIKGTAYEEILSENSLYTQAVPGFKKTTFTAIPYALWQNRGESEMTVWVREYFG
ncbi:MAG: Non-reducing end beta-L-arabinofuranosidase [Lentisphaerae bacterium ADurb.Bin242]|nr:MAG: Non-reducing end beta-L-arabinofuranosidase [Lentisphaerae bacterium ADurb.Bin242]